MRRGGARAQLIAGARRRRAGRGERGGRPAACALQQPLGLRGRAPANGVVRVVVAAAVAPGPRAA